MPDKTLTQSQITAFQQQIDHIKSNPFSVQQNLKDAIELGNKLAAVKLNSRFFSQFKTTTANWMKMYKKLKKEDFTPTLDELGNLKTVLQQIESDAKKYTGNKKTIVQEGEKEVAIDPFYQGSFNRRSKNLKQMEKISDVMEPFKKNKKLITYLDNFEIPNTPQKLKSAIQGFSENPKFQKHKATLSALINPTSGLNLKEFYIALQALDAEELEILANLCYHASYKFDKDQWWWDHSQAPSVYLQNSLESSRYRYWIPQFDERKREFNILKVKYMEAMGKAAETSLK